MDYVQVSLILGFVVPFLIGLLRRFPWFSNLGRDGAYGFTAIICFLIALGVALVSSNWNVQQVVLDMMTVLGASQLMYGLVIKSTGFDKVLEDKKDISGIK